MKTKKQVKRLTKEQISWILLISLIICIPIAVILMKKSFREQDIWINENIKEIQELTATVTDSVYHGGRSPYYKITFAVSNGEHLEYSFNKDVSGTFPIYTINIDGKDYYGFNIKALYGEVYKFKEIFNSLLIGLILLGPFGLFLFLRETYGYGFRPKKRNNQF